jgi:hypothetical protein
MKQTKVIIAATIVTIIIMLSCAYAMPAVAEVGDRGEFYPRLTVVVEKEHIVNTGLWVIYCQDKNGNLWAFYDDEGEWDVGDIANLLMWSVSEHEEEDEIIEVYWEGYTDCIDNFFLNLR